MIPFLLLAAAASAPLPTATEIIDGVWPASLRTDTLAVQAVPPNPDLVAQIRSLLRDRGLSQEVASLASPSEELPFDAARQAGAEMMLVVDLGSPWQARLLRVDRGFWQRPPSADSLELVAHIQGTTTPVEVKPPIADSWTEVGKLEGAALAVAACAPGHLWVLERDRVSVFKLASGRWAKHAERSLNDLARARMPVRDPMGRLLCLADGSVAWGTTDHASGARARLNGVIEVQDHFPGVPLGVSQDGRALLLGKAHEGMNIWHPFLSRWPDDAPTAPIELPEPVNEVLQLGPHILKTTIGQQTFVDDRKLGFSGPGISGWHDRSADGRCLVLLTKPRLDRGRDEVRLMDVDGKQHGPGYDVEGSVSASAISPSPNGVWIWLAVASAEQTTLSLREVVP